MRTHRFGQRLKLPATIAIKYQIRMGMTQYDIKKAEAEANAEALRAQPHEESAAVGGPQRKAPLGAGLELRGQELAYPAGFPAPVRASTIGASKSRIATAISRKSRPTAVRSFPNLARGR